MSRTRPAMQEKKKSIGSHDRCVIDAQRQGSDRVPQKELGDFIDHVVKMKKLNSADALKLRGRMQFSSGQLFGRVAKTCLTNVMHHAYRSGGTDASESFSHL